MESTDIVATIASEQLSRQLHKKRFWRMVIPFVLNWRGTALSQISPGPRRQICQSNPHASIGPGFVKWNLPEAAFQSPSTNPCWRTVCGCKISVSRTLAAVCCGQLCCSGPDSQERPRNPVIYPPEAVSGDCNPVKCNGVPGLRQMVRHGSYMTTLK